MVPSPIYREGIEEEDEEEEEEYEDENDVSDGAGGGGGAVDLLDMGGMGISEPKAARRRNWAMYLAMEDRTSPRP